MSEAPTRIQLLVEESARDRLRAEGLFALPIEPGEPTTSVPAGTVRLRLTWELGLAPPRATAVEFYSLCLQRSADPQPPVSIKFTLREGDAAVQPWLRLFALPAMQRIVDSDDPVARFVHEALDAPDVRTRLDAACLAEELQVRGVADRLLEALASTWEPRLRNAAAYALSKFGDARAAPLLRRHLADDRLRGYQGSLAMALARFDCTAFLDEVCGLLCGPIAPGFEVRVATIGILEEQMPATSPAIRSSCGRLVDAAIARRAAARAAGEVDADGEAGEVLDEALEHARRAVAGLPPPPETPDSDEAEDG